MSFICGASLNVDLLRFFVETPVIFPSMRCALPNFGKHQDKLLNITSALKTKLINTWEQQEKFITLMVLKSFA